MDPINNSTPSAPLQPGSSTVGKPATAAPDAAGAGNTGAATTTTVNNTGSSSVTTLSTISTQLQAAQAATASDSVFSSSKVNEIKQAISEGRFQVNSEKVANGLLDSVNELLGSRQRG